MFLKLKKISDEDMPKLMGIYAESNRENIGISIPIAKMKTMDLKK